MRAEFINPFLSAAVNVFGTMLNTTLARGPLALKQNGAPMHDVSGLIGMSGKCRGMVMVSVGRETALNAAGIMLGARPDEVDGDVMDAVGELTNMIAGAAKTQLEEYKLSMGLPTVICGKVETIRFPPEATPIVIPFESALGPVCLEVGLVETSGA